MPNLMWSTGTYQFPAMRQLAINSGDAFVLVFSVDNIKSFNELEQLRQTILDEREQAYLEATISSSSDLASGHSQSSISSSGGQTNSSNNNNNTNNNNVGQPANPSTSRLQSANNINSTTTNTHLAATGRLPLCSAIMVTTIASSSLPRPKSMPTRRSTHPCPHPPAHPQIHHVVRRYRPPRLPSRRDAPGGHQW